jgi:hypothetical protein
VFYRSVLKVSSTAYLSDSTGEVCEIVPIIARYRYVHEFNQLFGSKVRTYRRCSGCHSRDGQDGFLDDPHVCFLETRKLPPPCFGHLLLECPPLSLGHILHHHPDRVVRPNLGPGSTILRVRRGFDKSV